MVVIEIDLHANSLPIEAWHSVDQLIQDPFIIIFHLIMIAKVIAQLLNPN